MVFSASRVLILLLLCIGFLSFQPDKAFGLRSFELALGQSQEENKTMLRNQRILKAVNMEVMSTKKDSAKANKKFDQNQSSKRRVRRGSDPIHNRS
ncbi:hypothetical protein L6164_027094 [Bauhinia variegata]|uniref:Uncharacterized protein n=1 Tax=Bauhinia variegata TaxID=167791 RepID=A0ACB9LSI6_BAUVA|nr:hypothetical protein L6164_027094 [Bauhinia variegata]